MVIFITLTGVNGKKVRINFGQVTAYYPAHDVNGGGECTRLDSPKHLYLVQETAEEIDDVLKEVAAYPSGRASFAWRETKTGSAKGG